MFKNTTRTMPQTARAFSFSIGLCQWEPARAGYGRATGQAEHFLENGELHVTLSQLRRATRVFGKAVPLSELRLNGFHGERRHRSP